MFNNCTSLSVDLSNWKLIKIVLLDSNDNLFTNINGDFTYCINEDSSKVSAFNELKSLQNAKRDCSSKCYSTPRRLNNITNKCDITNCGQNDSNIYEYNSSCYEICPKKTRISSEDEYICESFSCYLFYDFEQKGCLLEIPKGFYLENENSQTINKCLSNCSTCSTESMKHNLCEKCNIEEEYYPKLNDTLNIYPYINCYKGSIDGYYLYNKETLNPCYSSCETCSGSGDENNHNCLSCKLGYVFKELVLDDKNCYENCTFYYYFDSNNKYLCTLNDSCPREYMLIKNRSKCIDNCTKDEIYKYEYSSQCYEHCPENTTISEKDIYKCEEIVTEEIGSTEETDKTGETDSTEEIDSTEETDKTGEIDSTVETDITEEADKTERTDITEEKDSTEEIQTPTYEHSNNEKTQEEVKNTSTNENSLDEAVNDFKDNLLGGKMNNTVSNLIKGNQAYIIVEDEEEGVTI